MNIAVKIPFAWTEDVTAKAAEMWNEGKSAGEISAVIGASRNAVISKAHRTPKLFNSKNGEGKGYRRGKGTSVPILDTQERKRRAAEVARAQEQRRAISQAQTTASTYDVERLAQAKQLVDLGRRECHFPINEGGPFLYCAAETSKGSYCECHRLRMLPSTYTAGLEGV